MQHLTDRTAEAVENRAAGPVGCLIPARDFHLAFGIVPSEFIHDSQPQERSSVNCVSNCNKQGFSR